MLDTTAFLADDFRIGAVAQTLFDPKHDRAAYEVRTSAEVYDVTLDGCDVLGSSFDVDYGQAVFIVSDGGTPPKGTNSSQGPHVMDASMGLCPRRVFSSPTGLSIKAQIQTFALGRRWPSIVIVPADDPMTMPAENLPSPNKSNRCLRFSIVNDSVRTTLGCGFDAKGKASTIHLTGSAQAGVVQACLRRNGPVGAMADIAIDATPTRVAFTENGVGYSLTDKLRPYLPALTWLGGPCLVYFAAFSYHTFLMVADVAKYQPWLAPYLCNIGGQGAALWGYQVAMTGVRVGAAT